MSEEKKIDVYLFTVTRMAVGFMFLWAFFDKAFGLGRTYKLQGIDTKVGTLSDDAWINGGDPTWGFLMGATRGKYFQDVFNDMAGSEFVTFIFMLGLLCIGVAMFLGIARGIAAGCGILMMFLMWLSQVPISTNPVVDSHVINALILAILGFTDHYGKSFVPQWSSIAENYPILK